jgi:hypothetical protein
MINSSVGSEPTSAWSNPIEYSWFSPTPAKAGTAMKERKAAGIRRNFLMREKNFAGQLA